MQLLIIQYFVLFSRLFIPLRSNNSVLSQKTIKMQRQEGTPPVLASWTQFRRACVTLLSIPRDTALLFRTTMPPFSPSSSSSLSLPPPPLYSTPCNMFFALIWHGLRQRTIDQRLALLSFLRPTLSTLPSSGFYRLASYRRPPSRILENTKDWTYIFVKSKPQEKSLKLGGFHRSNLPACLACLPVCLTRDVLDLDL